VLGMCGVICERRRTPSDISPSVLYVDDRPTDGDKLPAGDMHVERYGVLANTDYTTRGSANADRRA
jgi:hypothetical protein